MNKINQKATDNFNEKQQRFLKELRNNNKNFQNYHKKKLDLGRKARPLLVTNKFVRDCLRKNHKPAMSVHTYNLSPRQIKSLQCLQSHVGRGNLVLCYAENMYTQIHTQIQKNFDVTFGPAPQNIIFAQRTSKKAAPKIDFTPPPIFEIS